MFKNLKLDTKVFSIHHGWGYVARIDIDCEDELCYQYKSDEGEEGLWFDVNGKLGKLDAFPSIYWDIPEVTAPKRPLPMDTQIFVRDDDDDDWIKRHFKSYTNGGEVTAWNDGRTSFTVENPHNFTYWKQWKLPDEKA